MSYLNKLRKSRSKAQVAYQDFILHTRANKDGLFCFFEGKDNAYYISRVKKYINQYHFINCGGRENVLEVYKLINYHREYDKYKKGFFIDRDFNPPLSPPNPEIFETSCYSIENFYVSINVFQEILKNHFHLSEISQEFDVCTRLFKERQQEFHNAVILFNAWYACLINRKNREQLQTGVNLDDKLPKGFIKFELDIITQEYNTETIKNKFTKALEVSDEILQEKIKEFRDCEQDKVFRGKYELEFVLTIIELILQDSTITKKYIKSKIKFAFGEKISNEQALNLFSDCAETPQILDDYLERVIN